MAIGTLAGLFSGLFGVGGGSVIVPLLVLWLGYDERRATATSLAAIVCIAAFAAAAQGLYGNVRLLDAALVGVPAVGLDQHQAEATSLLAIVPVAIVGTYRQDRYGNVQRHDALLLGLLSVAGAAAGVALANALTGAFLRDAFAVLIMVVAAQLVHRALSGGSEAKKA
jgi:uncharacterized membrane protein YfcA